MEDKKKKKKTEMAANQEEGGKKLFQHFSPSHRPLTSVSSSSFSGDAANRTRLDCDSLIITLACCMAARHGTSCMHGAVDLLRRLRCCDCCVEGVSDHPSS